MSGRIALLIVLYMFIQGCATRPKKATYIPIPEGYLQSCELPAIPDLNGEMSDAFARAYKCAEQGNIDKGRIRNLPRQ